MSEAPEEIRRRFEEHGQGHVFADWDALSGEERAALLEDCACVDFAWLADRLAQLGEGEKAGPGAIEPAPVIRLPQTDAERAEADEARGAGEKALEEGRVAAFLVAGGQGTRLGFEGPKGCFPIGPTSGRTLFQWHAEQIRARARRHGATIPWYIMTSRANDAATRAHFEENEYYGFAPEDVMFFRQAMVPSVDFDGKLIRAERHRLALNPDGHGGSLAALVRSGALADMKRRGIDIISYFQVDNPLVTVGDPVFAGYHLRAGAEMSSKILDKACPEEKVGHICLADGELTVIEYSDMPFEQMHARDEDGRLRFWAGSIAIHMLNVDFVERVGGGARLPWHVARKKIPLWDGARVVRPEQPNGIKFETFVFDALPLAKASITMEVAREEEFAPVKNAAGDDSPQSCRTLMSNRFARWFERCGRTAPRDEKGDAAATLEISPLFALDADELCEKLAPDVNAEDGLVLE